MAYSILIKIPGLPKRPNQMRGRSWFVAKKNKDQWLDVLWKTVGTRKPAAPLKKAHVTMIRHSKSPPDYDGLVHSFKPVMDSLVDIGILEDDDWWTVGRPEYDWRPLAKGESSYIEIIVIEKIPA